MDLDQRQGPRQLAFPDDVAEAIQATAVMRRLEGGARRGWGSIKVTATIGETSWSTSIFPAKEQGGYMLPVKASVRKAEGLVAGDDVRVVLTL
jgi:Domain of unknown function (DUF1905)